MRSGLGVCCPAALPPAVRKGLPFRSALFRKATPCFWRRWRRRSLRREREAESLQAFRTAGGEAAAPRTARSLSLGTAQEIEQQPAPQLDHGRAEREGLNLSLEQHSPLIWTALQHAVPLYKGVISYKGNPLRISCTFDSQRVEIGRAPV